MQNARHPSSRMRLEPEAHLAAGRVASGSGARASRCPRQRSLLSLYVELYRLLQGSRLRLAVALTLLALVIGLKLLPPLATKIAVDDVLLGRPITMPVLADLPWPGSPKLRLLMLFGLVFLVALVGMAVGLWARWLTTTVNKRLQLKISRRTFEHAARLPLHRVYELKSGGFASLIRDDTASIGELVFSMFFNPGRALIQLVGGLIALLFVDWRLLLCSLVLLPAVWLSSQLWSRRIRPLFRRVRAQRLEVDAKTTEVFGGIRVVRAFGRTRAEVRRYVRGNHLVVRLELLAWRWMRGTEMLWELVLPLASGLLMVYGGFRVIDGQLTPGDLMMFLVYLTMLLEPVTVLANTLTQVQNSLSGFERILDLLDEPLESALRSGGRPLRGAEVQGRITLQGVEFQYPNTDAPVLHTIELEIEPGQTIALVGPSGSGKTTLCNLIARFYDPTAGTIQLDGQDLRTIDVESFRRHLAIVEQDVFLFDGTIAENIAYARSGADRSAIKAAARRAHAAEFIEALPEGYDTLVGERGVRLSGGQRQRLAIARAILADARILIMDEATSNLDTESERLIQQSLDEVFAGRTSIVIAHRLSTIRHADRILVLDHGRIIESGDHDSLIESGGRYREMVELQRVER